MDEWYVGLNDLAVANFLVLRARDWQLRGNQMAIADYGLETTWQPLTTARQPLVNHWQPLSATRDQVSKYATFSIVPYNGTISYITRRVLLYLPMSIVLIYLLILIPSRAIQRLEESQHLLLG